MKLRHYIPCSLLLLFLNCSNDNSKSNPVEENPKYTDTELLDMVQKDALKYFWDYAHPVSKLARERYHVDQPTFDQDIVTTGGSGFGILTLLVGIERGFVPRTEAVSRLTTAMDFLANADRFHGAWPHWMNGNTGDVIPFGTVDNGGDLVETAFLCEALICVREYFKNGSADEQQLSQKADVLWKGVEWDWYTKGGEDALYWHWSPNYGWQMNFKLEGYNECLVTYVMAASSATHPVGAAAYHNAWARNGGIVHSGQQYGYPVILNHNGATGNVGPLFWAHYSYLGLDPTQLTDQYANYWDLNRNHSMIIYEYCQDNPHNYLGYSEKCWGLTASYTRNDDGTTGYSAHQPLNDRGVISPTAALSSFPYTPEQSMRFLRYLYEERKGAYTGPAGPYDAFSPNYGWVTPRYLAIDQGTIVPMIENYRSGLLWNLFMNAPEVRQGLQNLGFSSAKHGI